MLWAVLNLEGELVLLRAGPGEIKHHFILEIHLIRQLIEQAFLETNLRAVVLIISILVITTAS